MAFRFKTQAAVGRGLRFLVLLLVCAVTGVSARAVGSPPAPGALFPDLSGRTLDGRVIRVSDYRGKVLLVDFWATWCGPCRREMPRLLAAWDRYRSRGFEILGVSLDHNADAPRNFQPAPGRTVPWPSLFDGAGWDSPFVQQLDVRGIPATFLLDRNGRLIASDVRGSQLDALIEQALSVPAATPTPPAARSTPVPSAQTPPVSTAQATVPPTGSPAPPSARIDPSALARGLVLLTKSPPGSQPDLERQLAQAFAADPEGAARVVWTLIDRTDPERPLAFTASRLLTPVLPSVTSVPVLDVAAWAAFAGGNPDAAYRIQLRAITLSATSPRSLGPRRELEVGLHARAALYELATGRVESARTRFTAIVQRVGATPPAPYRPEDTKYLHLLQSKLNVERGQAQPGNGLP